MRFEIVTVPYTTNRSLADSLRLGHGASAPMRCIGRGCLKRCIDNSIDLLLLDSWLASRARGILFESRETQGQEALTPELNGRSGNSKLFGDILTQNAIGRHPDNPGSLDKAERKASSCRPYVEGGTFVG